MATFGPVREETLIKEESRPANRLLMVSNRGPVEHSQSADGRVVRRHTDGGVSTALSAIAERTDVDWVACAATETDAAMARRGQRVRLGGGSRLSFVAPQPEAYELFYNHLCNPLLWFLQHGIADQLETRNAGLKAMHAWQLGYLPVNQSIAEYVAEALRGRIDRVMFHDYHFYLAPLFVRNLHPQAVLQHFIHIPWPDPAEWMLLPHKMVESICRGLLANDSVVFQTPDSADNFLATCHEFVHDVRIHFRDGTVESRERISRVWANPISVDPVDLHRRLDTEKAHCVAARLAPDFGERTIVRVDRLDPAKNVLGGFEAFETMLERHPEWIGRARFLAFLVPSRTSIPEYGNYTARVMAAVERINLRFASGGREPIKVFHEHDRLQALAAMRSHDVLLVNSITDGMNLVSKEASVINERAGALVLSRGTGSYAELGDQALGVNPRDIAGTAEALHQALSMAGPERQRRAEGLREAVLDHQLRDWLECQLADLGITFDREPLPEIRPAAPGLSHSLATRIAG
jgi:trehalose 6-phosphate synthase